MKFLFVGLGSIATKHIKDLVEITENRQIPCEIYVLRREITELPRELISYKITQVTDCGEDSYDVIFVTNPTTLHYKTLEKLKGKAKYYFIEKPIFENCLYDYKQLGINEKNTYIAAPLRHSETYKQLKQIVESHKVFSARVICSSYLPGWRPNIDYRKNYSAIKKLGGGVSLDLIHEIDYVTDLFGLPLKVLNSHGKYSDLEIDSDDLSLYIMKYDNLLCEVHLDYFGQDYQRKCELYTNEGNYIADFYNQTITTPSSVIDCVDNSSNLHNEMSYFLDFITGKEDVNLNHPENAFKVLKIALGNCVE